MLGPLSLIWQTDELTGLLALAWSNPGCCGHVGSDSVDGRYLSLPLSLPLTLLLQLCLSNEYKQILKKLCAKCLNISQKQ